jgi:hypothetical protein
MTTAQRLARLAAMARVVRRTAALLDDLAGTMNDAAYSCDYDNPEVAVDVECQTFLNLLGVGIEELRLAHDAARKEMA